MLLKTTIISLFTVFLAMYSCYSQDSLRSENVLILRKRKSIKRVYYIKKSPIVYKNIDSIQVGVINKIEFDGKNTFVITPKGRQYLESYVNFSSIAESFGLEL